MIKNRSTSARAAHYFRRMVGLLSIMSTCLFLASCGGAKYDYYFEKGKEIDFGNGKWIMNYPSTNLRHPEKIRHLALEEFQKIIPDSSLFEIFDLRRTKLVEETIPIHPTPEDLRHLREFSDCDYLINIENRILRDDMGSFPASSIVPNEQTNKAATYIEIYDLRNLELISKSSAIGTVEVTEDKDTRALNYVHSGATLAMRSVTKLIRRYARFQIK